MSKNQKKNKKKIGKPIKSLKSLENEYRKELNVLAREMMISVKQELLPFLKANQNQYVTDSVGERLTTIYRKTVAQV